MFQLTISLKHPYPTRYRLAVASQSLVSSKVSSGVRAVSQEGQCLAINNVAETDDRSGGAHGVLKVLLWCVIEVCRRLVDRLQ